MKGIPFLLGEFTFTFDFHFSQDQKHFMSIAADLIIEGVQEPVRLQIGCRAKIFAEDERFWIANRRPLVEDYTLRMAPVNSALVLLFPRSHDASPPLQCAASSGAAHARTSYVILQVRPEQLQMAGEVGGMGRLGSLVRSASASSGPAGAAVVTPTEPEAPSDEDDEPLLSGTGALVILGTRQLATFLSETSLLTLSFGHHASLLVILRQLHTTCPRYHVLIDPSS